MNRPLLSLLLLLQVLASRGFCATVEDGVRLDVAGNVYFDFEDHSITDTNLANELIGQARKFAEEQKVAEALQLATKALVADPNHEVARRVLGYRQVDGYWVGTYAERRLERGEVWHADFGWIRAEDVNRWEAGERRVGSRWVSVDDDVRRHRSIDRGWQIRTDHFRVITNESRAGAARLAIRLEALYQLWQQLYGGFFLSHQELIKRFDGKEISGYRGKPFMVTYYRTREQYNDALRRMQPRIEMTLGIYFDKTRQTHFFAGEEQDPGTIYHEAVHQFFQESRPAARSVGALANAWVIEGVSCYFESLTEYTHAHGRPYYTIGGAQAGRLPAARHRLLVDNFYVPLEELSSLGMNDLQRREDLARLYSQSAGLICFLMDGREGQYRRALVQLLKDVYAGRDKATTLEKLTGQKFAALDRQYRQFLERQSRLSESRE